MTSNVLYNNDLSLNPPPVETGTKVKYKNLYFTFNALHKIRKTVFYFRIVWI
jgi:hypothetical protein